MLVCCQSLCCSIYGSYVNEKCKQTAILETVVSQCPVLRSQRSRMKQVLKRPWLHLQSDPLKWIALGPDYQYPHLDSLSTHIHLAALCPGLPR